MIRPWLALWHFAHFFLFCTEKKVHSVKLFPSWTVFSTPLFSHVPLSPLLLVPSPSPPFLRCNSGSATVSVTYMKMFKKITGETILQLWLIEKLNLAFYAVSLDWQNSHLLSVRLWGICWGQSETFVADRKIFGIRNLSYDVSNVDCSKMMLFFLFLRGEKLRVGAVSLWECL